MPAGWLGCGPQPRVTSPGIIMGDEIRLRANGKEYVYRSDGRSVVACDPNATPVAGDVGAEPLDDSPRLQMAVAARADLARRLGIATTGIKIVSTDGAIWRDASLDCPEPGVMYAQVLTPGYRITLEAGGNALSITPEGDGSHCVHRLHPLPLCSRQ